MRLRRLPRDYFIIREGETGEEFFLIVDGKVDVLRRATGGELRRLETLGPGNVFGEFALMFDAPRSATCVAATDVELYVLGKADFKQVVATSASFLQKYSRSTFRGSEHAPKALSVKEADPECIGNGILNRLDRLRCAVRGG